MCRVRVRSVVGGSPRRAASHLPTDSRLRLILSSLVQTGSGGFRRSGKVEGHAASTGGPPQIQSFCLTLCALQIICMYVYGPEASWGHFM